jgi:hypothetical protein
VIRLHLTRLLYGSPQPGESREDYEARRNRNRESLRLLLLSASVALLVGLFVVAGSMEVP